ncbi:2-iminobutanoate/2-iminopropanoate deaminase [Holothuria leucospilota]|uniref:2-iminobutanoate/2-iminopropanoate deaminase n=1 Tax=Holothuria leucospilota TaxID=206669 RepID=A0A9Q1BVP6_HOLLE|nr:2-iminobutanoate/2-iminopropanoate deaminase [Holothuria leucospilota]
MATKLLRRFIKTNKAPAAIGPYNQAVAVGETVYVSGQIGLDPDSGSMVEGGFEAEAHQVFKNIGAILESSGLTYNDVVKCTVLLASMDEFQTLNAIYGSYFKSNYPARAAYQVAALPKNARVEIECIAVKNMTDE